jgi:hypothetical protein
VRCQTPHRLQLPPNPVACASPLAFKLHACAQRVQRHLHPPQRHIASSFTAPRPGGQERGCRWTGLGQA